MERVKDGADIATTMLFSPVSSIGAVLRGKGALYVACRLTCTKIHALTCEPDPRSTKIAQAKRRFRKKLSTFKKKRRLAANTLYLLIVQDTTQDGPVPDN